MLYHRICFKYFTGYVNHCNDDIKPLLIQLFKLKESIKHFENRKHMSFMLEEKHKGILNK